MYRAGLRGGILVLGLMVGSATVRAEEPDKDGSNWLGRVWARPADKGPDKEAESDKPEEKTGPTAREKAVAQRQKAEADLLRRDAVCTRLMQIAAETEDMELLKRAEQLSERSWSLYLQQTAHLPTVPGNGPGEGKALAEKLIAPENKPSAASGVSMRKERP